MSSELALGTGWTIYPTLSTSLTSFSSISIDVLVLALGLVGLASTMSSYNFITTIVVMAISGLSINRSSVYTVSITLISVLLVVILPVLTVALVMTLLDTHCDTCFFEGNYGGDILFYEHLFWFFGHPEVYVLILPAFGIVAMGITVETSITVFSSIGMCYAVICIGVLGMVVWAHHLFYAGIELDTVVFFSVATLLIAVPTGTKMFNYIITSVSACSASMVASTSLSIVILMLMAFYLLFTAGGSTGVILGTAECDKPLHDTYYVVAHFHYILSLGTAISILILLIVLVH